ncbi:hypothetical protein F8154_08845 [Alkaliphilus pronyensis]|uniref:Spore coat protein n=1 Tax=Alkaliphilus pronyensis TaxID=1482732 RepID=A0A6I0FF19_9FIRM|nr:hypothetical protein [Alkaliphilus pronyensis]KAB3534403.1 hypothetical protein F8154_08845 [Alkaliphilus pronyensis]
MHSQNQNIQSNGNKQLDSPNLKILEDQLNYESMMTKKYTNYAEYCTDTELKSLCQQAAQKHKQHYNQLLNYLNGYN